jgi:hypothetical protein
MKLLLLMGISEENLQIKVNLLGKKQISQAYLNCNLEKTIIFINILILLVKFEMGLSPFFFRSILNVK